MSLAVFALLVVFLAANFMAVQPRSCKADFETPGSYIEAQMSKKIRMRASGLQYIVDVVDPQGVSHLSATFTFHNFSEIATKSFPFDTHSTIMASECDCITSQSQFEIEGLDGVARVNRITTTAFMPNGCNYTAHFQVSDAAYEMDSGGGIMTVINPELIKLTLDVTAWPFELPTTKVGPWFQSRWGIHFNTIMMPQSMNTTEPEIPGKNFTTKYAMAAASDVLSLFAEFQMWAVGDDELIGIDVNSAAKSDGTLDSRNIEVACDPVCEITWLWSVNFPVYNRTMSWDPNFSLDVIFSDSQDVKSPDNVAAIAAGASVGAVLAIGIAIGAYIFIRRRQRLDRANSILHDALSRSTEQDPAKSAAASSSTPSVIESTSAPTSPPQKRESRWSTAQVRRSHSVAIRNRSSDVSWTAQGAGKLECLIKN